MNIAFDAGAIEVAKGSGVGNYTLNQLECLLRLYPEHQFFYFNVVEDSTLTDYLTAYPNFHRHYFYAGKGQVLRLYNGAYQALFAQLLKNFITQHQIEVFYITSPFLTSSDIGYNVLYQQAWFEGVSVVATVYDIIPYLMRKKYLPAKDNLDWYMTCVDMLTWADRLLVISNSVKEDMVKHLGFNPEKIDVIYGGVSSRYRVMDLSQAEKDAVYRRWGIDPDAAFFLCAVSADQRKNTDGMIKAYALLTEALRRRYVLVVAGRLADKEKHERLIKAQGVEGQVILTDYIQSNDELIKLYNLAAFVVIPSLYEGFGLPVVEAWACGKAVLASCNASLGEIVGDAGLVFDPYDIQDMARVLTEALTTADLSDLAARGREKLAFYQWERVAALSMAAINKLPLGKDTGKALGETAENQGETTAPHGETAIAAREKPGLACLFVRKTYYTDAWKAFLAKLGATYQVDVYLADFPADKSALETRYQSILYVVSPRRLCALNDTGRYPKGSWIILDAAWQKLLDIMTNVTDMDGCGAVVGEYLQAVAEEAPSFVCDRIIVADARQKHALLSSNPGLLGKVYGISPVTTLYANTPPSVKETVGEWAFQNFLAALSASPPLSADANTRESELLPLLDQLKTAEIAAKSYSDIEVDALSATLGFALGTEHVRKSASLRKLMFDGQAEKPLRVAMVSSWNTICGIAEYTKYFIENVSAQIDFEVWPNITDEAVIDDDRVAPRLWAHKGDMRKLIAGLMQSKPDVVHIQYTEGFFSMQGLTDIIDAVCCMAPVIVSCHNTQFLCPENSRQRELLNKARFTVHQERDIAQLRGNGIEAARISLVPLGQVGVPDREKDRVKARLGLEGRYPVIGSFGFLFQHKCVYETIEAVSLLKEQYPEILYIACNARYNVDASRWYQQECKALIGRLALAEQVIMASDFMEPEESLYLLQACDMSILPYINTVESASGAVRFCVAARRPLVLTNQPIFADMRDCAYFIEDVAKETIAKGIGQLLTEPMYTQKWEAVHLAANKNNWAEIERQYLQLYGDGRIEP